MNELPNRHSTATTAGDSAVYNRAELRRLLARFDAAMTASDLRTSASSSYVGSAERFVRWLEGDYRPRNAGETMRPTSSGPWSIRALGTELDRYRRVLEEAKLRPLAIQTYLHSAGVFLRWIAGSYVPRAPRPESETATRPSDLAVELGIDGLTLRNFLRARFPRTPDERGAAWRLSRDQADEVRRHFRGASDSSIVRKAEPDVGAVGNRTTSTDAPSDWFWEGHVQDVVLQYLLARGWHIEQLADTAARSQGHDIAASRQDQRLIVEVKGYPSVGYRDPRRSNEVKRAHPAAQAKRWFADALLKALRVRGLLPDSLVVLAFPDFPRYRSLLADTAGPLRRLRISVLLIAEDGAIEAFIPIDETSGDARLS